MYIYMYMNNYIYEYLYIYMFNQLYIYTSYIPFLKRTSTYIYCS